MFCFNRASVTAIPLTSRDCDRSLMLSVFYHFLGETNPFDDLILILSKKED